MTYSYMLQVNVREQINQLRRPMTSYHLFVYTIVIKHE